MCMRVHAHACVCACVRLVSLSSAGKHNVFRPISWQHCYFLQKRTVSFCVSVYFRLQVASCFFLHEGCIKSKNIQSAYLVLTAIKQRTSLLFNLHWLWLKDRTEVVVKAQKFRFFSFFNVCLRLRICVHAGLTFTFWTLVKRSTLFSRCHSPSSLFMFFLWRTSLLKTAKKSESLGVLLSE